jgi:hypothetical protein
MELRPAELKTVKRSGRQTTRSQQNETVAA